MSSNIVTALDALILPEQFQALTANCTTDAQLRTTLKNALEPIEAELATQQSRQKCAISVVLDNTPGIIASDIADNETQQLERRASGHVDEDLTHSIVYNRDKSSIVLLASLYHEAEHANQWDGAEYSKNERIMYNLAKALYDTGERNPFYRNNYAELKSRITEAQFYIDTYRRLKETHPQYIKSSDFVKPLKQAHFELNAMVNLRNIHQVYQRGLSRLQNGDYRTFHFKAAFPGIKFIATHQASQFWKTNCIKMYANVLKQLKQTSAELQTIIDDIEKVQAIERKQQEAAEKVADKLLMQQIALQYPQVQDMPQPIPWIKAAVHDSKSLLQQLEKYAPYHNLAMMIADNGDTMVLADVHPIPRPYSADPTLKARWEAEHPCDIPENELDEQNLDDEPR